MRLFLLGIVALLKQLFVACPDYAILYQTKDADTDYCKADAERYGQQHFTILVENRADKQRYKAKNTQADAYNISFNVCFTVLLAQLPYHADYALLSLEYLSFKIVKACRPAA